MNPLKRFFGVLFFCGLLAGLSSGAQKPNVILILADDLGLGDVHFYGQTRCKIDTPHLDRLAREGMAFTDAHTPSSVCTPTRYGILTGRYCWRTRLKRGVLGGCSSHLIDPSRETLATLFKKAGYQTACIGKWHLGMDLPTKDGAPPRCQTEKKGAVSAPSNIDWAGTIQNGPTDLGFDYFWGIVGSLGMSPNIWIENNHFVGAATTLKKVGKHTASTAPDFEQEEVLPIMTRKATEYIARQAASGQPFFLYMPLTSPHAPICPDEQFKGKSRIGPYGDFVMETDWSVGEVLQAVESAGIASNTLIVFTSDNGCSPAARMVDPSQPIVFSYGDKKPLDPEAHYPSYIYRGNKADLYEGGHRVPFIATWLGHIPSGTTNDAVICLTDLFATSVELLHEKEEPESGEDSVSILPLLLGKETESPREAVVHHSIHGDFSIRQGNWKLLVAPGSGGWSPPKPGKEDPAAPKIQLYNLADDPGETTNLQDKYPEIVKRLSDLLEEYKRQNRSVPLPK